MILIKLINAILFSFKTWNSLITIKSQFGKKPVATFYNKTDGRLPAITVISQLNLFLTYSNCKLKAKFNHYWLISILKTHLPQMSDILLLTVYDRIFWKYHFTGEGDKSVVKWTSLQQNDSVFSGSVLLKRSSFVGKLYVFNINKRFWCVLFLLHSDTL